MSALLLWDIKPWRPPAELADRPPSAWGPGGWEWLHDLAVSYPHNPSIRDVKRAGELLTEFFMTVPCLECYAHIIQYVTKHPPNFMNSESFQHWVWLFHNNVNMRLGKKVVSLDEYRIKYADKIRLAVLQ